MQIEFFSIPVHGDRARQENLNAFLRSHRVLTVHREFVAQGANSFWALAVEYLDGPGPVASESPRSTKARVDYKNVLSPADFAVFVRLRSLDQFSKLKQAFETKYGDAKSSYSSQSKQQVYRWRDGDVKIKLKMIETMGQFKMACYYSPLSTQLNEKRLEDIPPDLYKLIAPKEGETAKVAPLLGE